MRPLLTLLQGLLILLSIAVLGALVWLPLTEGRAQGLPLLEVYTDPFILYGALIAVLGLLLLYHIFQLLEHGKHGTLGSAAALHTLRSIRWKALLCSILLVLAGLYIRLYHHPADDPAGFLALCVFLIVCCGGGALGAWWLEKSIGKNSLE
ncbi:DUF2975 domain-containing protein [Candidatus Peribacteria bacterium]|nr:DUF2975 domain-containing protein [Candidatus Peribacteria bacterium]